MCGIAGVYVKDPYVGQVELDRFADHLFAGIEKRGRDATGFIAIKNDNTFELHKNNVAAKDFVKVRPPLPVDTKMLLMHTRYATQGRPEDMENNHPVLFDTCYVTHNGIIRNDAEVFTELACPRPAEVDSVAIPAALTHHGMGELADIKTALGQVAGAMAIAACDPGKFPGKLLLAKGTSSPLYVINHKRMLVWASSLDYIKDAWGRVYGTPPTRKGSKENKYSGVYEFKYGDMWIIENDEFTFDTFQPNWGGTRSSRNHFPYDDDGYDYDYYGNTTGFNRRWTCKNEAGEISFKNCVHPCASGCESLQCFCYEGSIRHPKRVQEVPGNGTARSLSLLPDDSGRGLARVEDRNGRRCANGVASTECVGCFFRHCPNTQLAIETARMDDETQEIHTTCDGCAEQFSLDDLHDYLLDGTQFLLCHACNDTESEAMEELGAIENPTQQYSSPEVVSPQVKYERIVKVENAVHQRALLEVAFECDSTVAFIEWILFRCPLEDLEDDAFLATMRDDIEREYDNACKIARILVKEAEERGSI